jgi:hypothetical protein
MLGGVLYEQDPQKYVVQCVDCYEKPEKKDHRLISLTSLKIRWYACRLQSVIIVDNGYSFRYSNF